MVEVPRLRRPIGFVAESMLVVLVVVVWEGSPPTGFVCWLWWVTSLGGLVLAWVLALLSPSLPRGGAAGQRREQQQQRGWQPC